jgi:acyl carrier protein phosphodiesterase
VGGRAAPADRGQRGQRLRGGRRDRKAIDLVDRRLKLYVAAGVLPGPETPLVMRLRARLEDDKRRFVRLAFDVLTDRGLSRDDRWEAASRERW